MAVAWLITFLALVGVVFGALDHARLPSAHLAAAGGGLLAGICAFWLLPEISEMVGWTRAISLVLIVCALLLLAGHWLGDAEHSGTPAGAPASRHSLVAPLLAATALHSFLDGWSVRTLAVQAVANVAAPVGLALHKIPEGLALGWIARKSLKGTPAAISIAGAIELMTPLGAFVEPFADHSGFAAFGPSWTAIVLATVGGSFLFLGVHAVIPERKKLGVMAIFLATFAAVGLLALLRPRTS